ncbi:Ig-like domain-containing protein [Pseudonocardia sp. RS11V-5]|uniref:L,D-transpeptidase n=1 Tax=Pseudonocardia terrae TaxID=2905831 RepID=UPI001E461927|nr:Ig-like domain-containing protein [Pseudonocardia terrae]MCE3556424.1 Ig-like domain-containing protein [Pseudonocardia terrae]
MKTVQWRAVRRILAGAVALGVSAGLVAACASANADASHTGPTAAPQAPATVVTRLDLQPAAGATDVHPLGAARATATAGTLDDVALTDSDGDALPGTYSGDRSQWTATAPLDYRETYTWSGTMVAPDGAATPLAGSFTTVAPKRLVKASTNIGEGATVGVAAPIEIRFNRDLSDAAKAEVERGLTVTTSTPVEGAWAWLPDDAMGSRVHWRPKEYWPVGTQVSVAAPLYGKDLGTAGYGSADLTTHFTIGRSQIVKADENSHRIVVIRDGQQVMDLPASYGLETDPRRVTRSGVHIVMAKSEKVLMSNPDYGYQNVPEYWAVRISNNGEFIHANPASQSAQGRRNISHGCINLSIANAKAYFQTAMYGDPVEVTGSSVPLSAQDGDVYDWAVPWDAWKAMSKLTV